MQHVRPFRALRIVAVVALAALSVVRPAAASVASVPVTRTVTKVEPFLAQQLADATSGARLLVFVDGAGNDLAPATTAVEAAGLALQRTMPEIGVAVALGTAAEIRSLVGAPGVTYLQGDAPLQYALDTANVATREEQARSSLFGADGHRLDGTGVSIAIIDSGIDGTHPFFKLADGTSKVRRNLKAVCTNATGTTCPGGVTSFADVTGNDSDDTSAGGHGTHVAGIAGGVDVDTARGATPIHMHGSAPGATLIGLSVGEALSVNAATLAFQWVYDHQHNPCSEVQTAAVDPACPPIKVTSNSYGPTGGGTFSPSDATVKLQDALVTDKGVVSAWAAGNDGGDGTGQTSTTSQSTNPPGQDPLGGILMVASYNDANSGTRDGAVSSFSSRGLAATKSTWPDISAPGENITSSCRATLPVCSTGADPLTGDRPGDYNTISGTSMATPMISGIVADLFEAKPDATPAQIELAIENGAHKFTDGAAYTADIPAQNPDNTTSFDKGHGLVDLVASYGVLTSLPVPDPIPVTCSNGDIDDKIGDATYVNTTDTGSSAVDDPALDIVKGSLVTRSDGGIDFRVRMADLTPPTGYGQVVEWAFGVSGTTYFLLATRAAGTSAVTGELGDFGGASGTRRNLATLTATFADSPANLVTITLPNGVAITPPTTGTAPPAPSFSTGSVVSGLAITTRRQVNAVAISAIPQTDVASSGCPYTVGATAATAPPTVPESPSVPLLALGGLGVGTAVVLRQRRRAARS